MKFNHDFVDLYTYIHTNQYPNDMYYKNRLYNRLA